LVVVVVLVAIGTLILWGATLPPKVTSADRTVAQDASDRSVASGEVPATAIPTDAGLAVSPLASFAITTGGWNLSFPLDFTVPFGVSHVLYAWAIGGGLYPTYLPPVLPSGLNITASNANFEGMAFGALAPGSYSTDLWFPGWTNTVSIVVYGISQDANASYQFASVGQGTNLTLPAGASVYLGIESTGGTWPVLNPSIAFVDKETGALQGGETGVIGRQLTNSFTFTTQATGYGIVAVGIYGPALASPSFAATPLAAFSVTTGGWNLSFPLTFCVPAGVSQVLYAWAIGGGLYPTFPLPELPSGLNVTTFTGFEGMALGSLSPGTYFTDLSYPGWTNIVSIVVYGIFGDANASFQFGSVEQGTNLTLPSGASVYVGIESTGGTWPVLNSSISLQDEQAAALQGGETGVIGRQVSDAFSFSTQATGYGIVAMGIYLPASTVSSDPPVTFQETGLPAGGGWTLALGDSVRTTTSSSVSFAEPSGAYRYFVTGPPGYQVVGISPSGTVTASGQGVVKSIGFAKAKTVALEFEQKGLAAGSRPWCVELGGWERCSSGGSLTYADLTPGTYTYAVVPVARFSASAKVGTTSIPLGGSLTVSKNEVVALTYLYPYIVTFKESGLPTGTSWSVSIQGHTVTSTNSTLIFDLPNGLYAYKVGGGTGYLAHGQPGLLRVSGARATVSITFVPRHHSPTLFAPATPASFPPT
jgi:hypothetical protein